MDNMRDMIAKKGPPKRPNQVRGSRVKVSKLNEAAVALMREIWATGQHNYAEVAKMFGISVPRMYLIVQRKAWRHVP